MNLAARVVQELSALVPQIWRVKIKIKYLTGVPRLQARRDGLFAVVAAPLTKILFSIICSIPISLKVKTVKYQARIRA